MLLFTATFRGRLPGLDVELQRLVAMRRLLFLQHHLCILFTQTTRVGLLSPLHLLCRGALIRHQSALLAAAAARDYNQRAVRLKTARRTNAADN